jgi:hypothetical protein
MFADQNSGILEGFLGAIYHRGRESAQRALDRVTQLTRASFGDRLPESFKSEIFEYPDGSFNYRPSISTGTASFKFQKLG